MEAFSGPPKTMTIEKFIGQHQGQNNGANIGDMTLSTEFEVLWNIQKLLEQIIAKSYYFLFEVFVHGRMFFICLFH